ncbi:MAG: sigma-70 family RNA polymerase sigma factor [Bryobacterales bacterium]|nr:sigma-70 family RNA polymerase sigma factor [Bryobacterales bacterium]
MQKGDVTELLQQWSGGDPDAFERLMPLVYEELRRMADQFLRHERVDHTLQPTALVHELYLKMVDQERAQWQDRVHFFSVAAKMMRRILVDHARKHITGKRGSGARHLPIEDALDKPAESSRTILAVDAALTRFAEFDPERSKIVELRYFGGLDLEEIAGLLQVSRSTVKRHWTVARMWLHRELEADLHGHKSLERN